MNALSSRLRRQTNKKSSGNSAISDGNSKFSSYSHKNYKNEDKFVYFDTEFKLPKRRRTQMVNENESEGSELAYDRFKYLDTKSAIIQKNMVEFTDI